MDSFQTPGTDPWERRQAESGPAWEAFTTYRDMGPSRSIAKVGRTISKSTTLLKDWSAVHDWPNRARAWDMHVDDAMREAWLKTMTSMVDETNALARELVRKGGVRLGRVADGDKLPYDVVRGLEVAARVQRDGMDTIKPDKAQVQDEQAGTISVTDLVRAVYEQGRKDAAADDDA